MQNLPAKYLAILLFGGIAVVLLPFQYFSLESALSVKAQSTPVQKNEIEQLIEQSDNQVDQGQTQAGLQTLEKALVQSKAVKNQKHEGIILHRFGSIYLYELNNPVKARVYYQQALKIAQILPNLILEGKALVNLGNTYNIENNHEQAIIFHKKALDVTRKSEDCYVQSVVEEALAYDYLVTDLPRSTRFLENAAETIQNCSDRSLETKQKTIKQEAVILTSLGRNYFLLHALGAVSLSKNCLQSSTEKQSNAVSCLDKGIKAYQRAIDLSTQIDDYLLVVTARNGLADIYKNQGLYANAQNVLEQSVQDLQRLPKHRLLWAKSLASLLEVYLNLRQWAKVNVTGNEALMLLQQQPSDPKESIEYQSYRAQVLMSLGDASRLQELYPDAIKNYQASVEVSQAVITQIQAIRQSQNMNWLKIQDSLARQRLKIACAQMKAVYVLAGQPDQLPTLCKSGQP